MSNDTKIPAIHHRRDLAEIPGINGRANNMHGVFLQERCHWPGPGHPWPWICCSVDMTQWPARSIISVVVFLISTTASMAVPKSPTQELAAPTQKAKAHPSGREPRKDKDKPQEKLTQKARVDLIRKAQVWTPTNVAAMDMLMGPQGHGAFAPNAMVTCDYVEARFSGASPKFACRIDGDDEVKVRFGADNGEVQGAVLASRLLWALGFGADRVYPVRVTCRGCAADPWTSRERTAEVHVFDPAAIERKPDGHDMSAGKQTGWTWPELALVDEAQGGAPVAHRDALTLLAVFMQHSDNKAEQQRLLCLPGGLTAAGTCSKPFMARHEVGLTFGHANFSNRADTASVNFVEWANTPVWRNPKTCVGHMSKSSSGTLGDPTIREAGRAFLADLLVQLTDDQLTKLFEVARVDARSRDSHADSTLPGATAAEWVGAFKHKRDEIVTNRCPA